MHVSIAPSILAADITCLADEVGRAVEGGCDALHVDIMDYHFVPNLTFGPHIVKALKKLTDLPLDVHLMADNPLDMIEAFADAGSDLLTLHIEVLDDPVDVFGKIADLGVKPGLTLKPGTPVDTVLPYLANIDILLIMSVEPGFGGQAFMESSYERIRKIATAAKKTGRPIHISVDGGVNLENAPKLVDAGCNYLVAGTSVFKDHNARENIKRFREVLAPYE